MPGQQLSSNGSTPAIPQLGASSAPAGPASDARRSNEETDAILSGPGMPFEVEMRLVNGIMLKTWKNLPSTIGDFWCGAAQLFAKRPYLICYDETWTYERMHDEVLHTANWLRQEYGVRKGDRVGIMARNLPEWVAAYWAIQLLGGIATALNAFSEGTQLAYCIADSGCRVVVADAERYQRIKPQLGNLFSWSAQRQLGAELEGVVVIGRKSRGGWLSPDEREWSARNGRRGLADWQELCQKWGKAERPTVAIIPEDDASILYTSGTTGKPKGVLSTQRNWLSCLRLASNAGARVILRKYEPMPPAPPDNDAMKVLLTVPLFHTTGLQSGLAGASQLGYCIVFMHKWDVDVAAKLINQHQVAGVVGVGFMIRALAASKHELPSILSLGHGGSASAKELPAEVDKKFTGALLSQGYGLTEVNGVAVAHGGEEYAQQPTSAGRAPIAVDLLVVDPETGVALPRNTVGELWIKGPGVAKGYWKNPEETAKSWTRDGWFKTGDLAKIDGRDYVFIVDRAKDIIIRGGENISATEVENAVYNDTRIADCAAVALPHPKLGECVGVVAIPHEGGGKVTPEDVIKAAAKSLPKHAVPEYVWVRNEPLERNPNGKVLKATVRDALRARREREQGRAAPANAKL